ncbi:MAG: AMP-binding protein, partial [Sulfuritalea sp.]|nr:AMP-binding protein [Sulfuritalea sp.]
MSHEILTGAQAALKWSQRTPEATAVVHDGSSYSYSTLATHIAQFVVALEREGIGHGDLVGVCCRNQYLPLVLCWSLEVIGATTTYLSSKELGDSEILDHCDAVLAESPLSQASAPRRRVHLTGDWIRAATGTPVTAADIRRLDHPTSDDTAVFIDGSSGTTGRKKYCVDTRRMIVERNRLRQKLHFPGHRRRDYINLYGTQLNTATITGVLALNKGARIVLSSVASFFSDIEQYPASKSTLLLRDAEYLCNNFHDVDLAQRLDSLRVVGAFLPQHIRSWLESRIAERVVNTYSSNETG